MKMKLFSLPYYAGRISGGSPHILVLFKEALISKEAFLEYKLPTSNEICRGNMICVGQVNRRFFTSEYLHDINIMQFSSQVKISVIFGVTNININISFFVETKSLTCNFEHPQVMECRHIN